MHQYGHLCCHTTSGNMGGQQSTEVKEHKQPKIQRRRSLDDSSLISIKSKLKKKRKEGYNTRRPLTRLRRALSCSNMDERRIPISRPYASKHTQLINRLKGKFKQNYKLGPTIGKGGFSKVYSAFKLNTRIYSLVNLKLIN